jgi:hypothetical protein
LVDRDRGDLRFCQSVVDAAAERIVAQESVLSQIVERAVGVQIHGAVAHVGDRRHDWLIVVVRVVIQDVPGQFPPLAHRVGVVVCHGCEIRHDQLELLPHLVAGRIGSREGDRLLQRAGGRVMPRVAAVLRQAAVGAA